MKTAGTCHKKPGLTRRLVSVMASGFFLTILMVRSAAPVPAAQTHDAGNTPPHSPLEARYTRDLKVSKDLITQGRNREALRLLSPYVSDPSRYPVAVSDFIALLVWDERFQEATDLYEKLPASLPRRDYLKRNIARAYYETESYPTARDIYDGLLKEMFDDEELQKGLVYSSVQMGDMDTAFRTVKGMAKTPPYFSPLVLEKARELLGRSEHREALKVYDMLAQLESERVYSARDDAIAGLGPETRKKMLSELKKEAADGNGKAGMDYLHVLTVGGEHQRAVDFFSSLNMPLDAYTDYQLSWVAWSHFKAGRAGAAGDYYEKILSRHPGYVRAQIGLAYTMAFQGEHQRAHQLLDSIGVNQDHETEIMFARAYVYEKSGLFLSAVHEYDGILAISPRSQVAKKLRLQALNDMGAHSFAFDHAVRDFTHDRALMDAVMGDMAVDRINWQEHTDAIGKLQLQIEDGTNRRASYDYVVALAENGDMEEAVRVYEGMLQQGVTPPPYVMDRAASAYLYLEMPHKALELYDAAVQVEPGALNYNSRLGRFYALQELRRWDEARETIHALDEDTPEVVRRGRKPYPNWPKSDIKLARGWHLLYKDRLEEAERYFEDLRVKAPANTNFRTGLAYAYKWRGWPRKALREFTISANLDPKDINAEMGKISELNYLAKKEEAREKAAKLIGRHPKNKHAQKLVRNLKLEEMRELTADFAFNTDDDGVDETRVETRITQPLSLYTRLYAELFWQKTEDDEQKTYFRRAGLGIIHTVSSSWRLQQRFSVNYDDGEDFGSLTELRLTPDDYWEISLSYDSFTTDVPMRARVFDIDSDRITAGITYRESDWRSYHLGLSRMDFSDGNERYQGSVGYEQGLWTGNDWKMRGFLDFYTSNNSLEDAPYFNPDEDYSLTLTHLTEHTVHQLYDRRFVHRLYLSAGGYKQAGYSAGAVGTVRYEHDIDFSDVHALRYGARVGRNVYDGEAVTGYGFYLTWRLLF